MRKLTTENPKDNIETALNLFYIKDYETWARGGGPGPEYADVSLYDFIRSVVKTHIPDTELPEDNDNLSMMMGEWLFDGQDTAEGIVALLYTTAWAYAELRSRLAAYEDRGFEPEEIDELELKVATLETIEKLYDELGTLDHLRELVQAEKDGRLMVLPCKVGDTVYLPNKRGLISTYKVTSIHISACSVLVGWEPTDGIYSNVNGFEASVLGQSVFLTREEAEEELKGSDST